MTGPVRIAEPAGERSHAGVPLLAQPEPLEGLGASSLVSPGAAHDGGGDSVAGGRGADRHAAPAGERMPLMRPSVTDDMPAGAEQAAVRAARLVAFAPQPELHQPQQHAPSPWRIWRGWWAYALDFLWSLGQWKRSD